MVTHLRLRLPWYLSAPSFTAAAIVAGVALSYLAGPLFERTFRNDIDPLAAASMTADGAPPATASGQDGTPAAAPPAAVQGSSVAAPAAAAAGPRLLTDGRFVDGDPGHHGKGKARLIQAADGSLVLRLEDFSVTNGPDLFVVLSTDPAGSRGSATNPDALNLGGLKATDGNINYAVPGGTDVAKYRSVMIYCRAFRAVFAVATLESA